MTIVVHLWQVLAVMTVILWAGYGMRWWQDRGDYDAGRDDEATAAWIEGLADPLPVLARARELLDAP